MPVIALLYMSPVHVVWLVHFGVINVVRLKVCLKFSVVPRAAQFGEVPTCTNV